MDNVTAALMGSVVIISVILIIIVIAFGPIFSIWAINLLFGLNIPINFWTWLSTLWLMMLISSPNYHYNGVYSSGGKNDDKI